jgi:hypothetical protein
MTAADVRRTEAYDKRYAGLRVSGAHLTVGEDKREASIRHSALAMDEESSLEWGCGWGWG